MLGTSLILQTFPSINYVLFCSGADIRLPKEELSCRHDSWPLAEAHTIIICLSKPGNFGPSFLAPKTENPAAW